MPRTHQTKYWQLEVPVGWEVVGGSDELVSLFKPDGIGMLRVLTAEERNPVHTPSGEVFLGHLSGTVRTTPGGSTFSRTWSLSCRGKRLFVSYRCASKHGQLELAEVDQIVRSISETDHEKP